MPSYPPSEVRPGRPARTGGRPQGAPTKAYLSVRRGLATRPAAVRTAANPEWDPGRRYQRHCGPGSQRAPAGSRLVRHQTGRSARTAPRVDAHAASPAVEIVPALSSLRLGNARSDVVGGADAGAAHEPGATLRVVETAAGGWAELASAAARWRAGAQHVGRRTSAAQPLLRARLPLEAVAVAPAATGWRRIATRSLATGRQRGRITERGSAGRPPRAVSVVAAAVARRAAGPAVEGRPCIVGSAAVAYGAAGIGVPAVIGVPPIGRRQGARIDPLASSPGGDEEATCRTLEVAVGAAVGARRYPLALHARPGRPGLTGRVAAARAPVCLVRIVGPASTPCRGEGGGHPCCSPSSLHRLPPSSATSPPVAERVGQVGGRHQRHTAHTSEHAAPLSRHARASVQPPYRHPGRALALVEDPRDDGSPLRYVG